MLLPGSARYSICMLTQAICLSSFSDLEKPLNTTLNLDLDGPMLDIPWSVNKTLASHIPFTCALT